ncbi:tape measure protein [uncultured Aquitalea sp.]|uniref:tape measure protein n=1 Tax=uncultured Aquitalea sp. TaxID=540272 RepID=UPI0025F8906D|nr:tape measure protein [uncultured Aquitalea sp.]
MKTLEYLIKANASDFVTAVTKAETVYSQALKGMGEKARQVSLFKLAKEDVSSTGTALLKLKATAEKVRKALGEDGGNLQQRQQLLQTEAAISKTEAAMRGQVSAVVSMRQSLAAAGVDTRNLAAEQEKMAAAIAKASGAVIQTRRLGAARDVLGVRSNLEINREISLVQAAYDRLAKAGSLSHSELDRAAAATRAKIADLRQELRGGAVEAQLLMAPPAAVNQVRRTGNAREVLGVRSQVDIQREMQQVNAAFSRLAGNPNVSMAELARASAAAKTRIAELRAELQGALPGSSFLNTAAGKFAAMAGAVLSLNAALSLTKSILSTAGQFETLRTQLTAVEKSATKGGEAFKYIQRQAMNTPFQVTNLTQTYIRLKNFGLDPTKGSMQAIIDQAAKLGGSQEMLERITLALGQAWTKQKLQGEEIMQLNEAGVPVWDLLSRAMGKTSAELMKMSENGQLGRDAIEGLMVAMEKDAAGVAAQQMATWNGIVSNAIDLWQAFLDDIGQAGLLQFAKEQITALTQALGRMKETGELGQIARDIADALTALGKAALATGRFLVEHRDAIAGIALIYGGLAGKRLFVGLAEDLLKFAAAARKAAAALAAMKEAETIGDVLSLAKGGVARKAVKPAASVSQVAVGAEGMVDVYRLAKTAPGTAGEVVATGSAVAQAGLLSKASKLAGDTIAKSAQVASKGWSGLTAEMTYGGSRVMPLLGTVATKVTLIGSVMALAYQVATKVIPDTIALHELESAALARKEEHLKEIIRLQREAARDKDGKPSYSTGSATRILSKEELMAMTEDQLKAYNENVQRAYDLQHRMAVARAQEVTHAGGNSDADQQYQDRLKEASLYKKALNDVAAVKAERLKMETDGAAVLKAARQGALENLAADLAREQKLYERANEQLQAAVAARQKHQDSWAANKAVDPAAKAAEPQGVTDYYDGLRKAQDLARKALDSQRLASKTGLDGDMRAATRDATAAETAFSKLMDTINALRSSGKITQGEFNLFNDQASRAQDTLDAGQEKNAKVSLAESLALLQSIKDAADRVKKLDINFSFNEKEAIRELDSIMTKIQQEAALRKVNIGVDVATDAKNRTEARQGLGLPERPLSELNPGPTTEGSSKPSPTVAPQVDTPKSQSNLSQYLDETQQQLNRRPLKIPVNYVGGNDMAANLQAARMQAGLPIQSNAEGGAIQGPGTGTSDSILSWLSNGEFVVKAAATQYYGPELLHAINQRRLPRFAQGGMAGSLPAVSRAVSAMPSLQADTSSAAGPSGHTFNLWLPGESAPIAMQAPDTSVKQLHDAALKHNLKFGK